MDRPKVYYAIPIRGKMGAEATVEYMAINCARAKRNLEILQVAFPHIEWISVAPYDRIVQKLLARRQVDIRDVLQADFEVGDECDALFAHLWEPSGGAEQEYDRQTALHKVCAKMYTPDWPILHADVKALGKFVLDVYTTYTASNELKSFRELSSEIVTPEQF